MKRLTALLCLGALVLLASDVGASGLLPTLRMKQLRWADYSDASSSGISAYRDTTFLALTDGTAGSDTSEVISMDDFAWGFPGLGVTTGSVPVMRIMLVGSITNADSVYYAVDGAFSPLGPWTTSSAFLGRVSGVTGAYTEGLATTYILCDTDALTGVTAGDQCFRNYPYLRLRIHGKEAGAPLPGAKLYISYYAWDGGNVAEARGVAPKFVHRQLRWANVAGLNANGSYASVSYVDTASIYKSNDTTATTTCIDTTEALDMSGVVFNNSWSSGTAGSAFPPGVTVGLAANALMGGTQSDSIQVFVDIGLTPTGPWSESSQPHIISRAGAYKAIAGPILQDWNSVSTLGNITRLWGAPYIRFRIKTELSANSGYQGARCYVGFTPKVN